MTLGRNVSQKDLRVLKGDREKFNMTTQGLFHILFQGMRAICDMIESTTKSSEHSGCFFRFSNFWLSGYIQEITLKHEASFPSNISGDHIKVLLEILYFDFSSLGCHSKCYFSYLKFVPFYNISKLYLILNCVGILMMIIIFKFVKTQFKKDHHSLLKFGTVSNVVSYLNILYVLSYANYKLFFF